MDWIDTGNGRNSPPLCAAQTWFRRVRGAIEREYGRVGEADALAEVYGGAAVGC